MKSKVGIGEGVERVGRQMARNEMPGQERPLSMCWLTAASEKQAGFDRKDRAFTVSHVPYTGWKLCRGGYGFAQHGAWGTVAFLPKHTGVEWKAWSQGCIQNQLINQSCTVPWLPSTIGSGTST